MLKQVVKQIAILAAILGLMTVTGFGAQKTITMKIPSAYATALPNLGTTIMFVEKVLNLASEGAINVKVYEPDKLIGTFEILDAVSRGKVVAGYASPGFWAGKLPAAPLFASIPFGPESPEYLAWFRHGNGQKYYQEMYDNAGYNVKPIICGMLPPETSGWFRKPINSVADLKGLNMRFFGFGGTVMQKLGVSVSLLGASEIFPALEKGVIDATEFSMPAIDARLGFYKVAKYNYFPGWHQQGTTLELLVNKDFYNKTLNEGQRCLLETACLASIAASIAEGEALQYAEMKKNVEERGVEIKRWSPEMMATFKKTWEAIAEENAKNDPFFKKVYSDLSQFRSNYDIWEANAFLPRDR
jgi:TRAP-type mannitol/chloroaromatic compound transport system substrate-binding protein